jgi:transcription antitermination factor NusG
LRDSLEEKAIREIEVHDTVMVTDGAYQNLTGTVVGLSPDKEHAYIDIDGLVSLDTYVELPLQFISKVDA